MMSTAHSFVMMSRALDSDVVHRADPNMMMFTELIQTLLYPLSAPLDLIVPTACSLMAISTVRLTMIMNIELIQP